jgi:hypothetical protein
VIVVFGIAIVGALCHAWWKARSLGNEARAQAVPACEEQLGIELCREHLERYHEDCARLTLVRPRRTSPGPMRIDAEAYQRCVVLGVDEWVAENGRRHEEEERQRRQRYPTH